MATKTSPNTRKKVIVKKAGRPASDSTVAPVAQTPVVQPKKTKPSKSAAKSKDTQPAHAPVSRHKIASVWKISRSAWKVIWGHRKLFFGIALVYVVCNLLLVQTVNAVNLANVKQTLTDSSNSLSTGVTLYSSLVGGLANGASQSGAAYQSVLLLIVGLATIWALRETLAERRVSIRDSFYKGMYPLVPSILVLFIISAQLIPIALGSFLYTMVVQHGIAVNVVEVALWGLLPLIGLVVSAFFLTSSTFAAYIVTLPDMTPLKALRSARQLVKGRRWTLVRKLLFLPLALLIIGGVIMLPFLLFLTSAAAWIFFILSSVGLLLFHAYLYSLYRELLI